MTPVNLRKPSHVTVHEGGSDRADWRKRALCLNEDPELFFPIGNTGPALQQIEEAKAVCRRCPIEAVCLERALERREPHGVWGGLDDTERANLARSRQRKAKREAGPIDHGTEGGYKAHRRRGEKACTECQLGRARTHRWRIAEQRARKAAAT